MGVRMAPHIVSYPAECRETTTANQEPDLCLRSLFFSFVSLEKSLTSRNLLFDIEMRMADANAIQYKRNISSHLSLG